jgi:hypothetical protein
MLGTYNGYTECCLSWLFMLHMLVMLAGYAD